MRFAMMARLIAAFVLWVFAAADSAPGAGEPPHLVAPTEPLSPAEEAKKFHLPPGFEAQLVAAEPDIHKPINIAFDAKGRLWVTDTVEYPYPAPPDRKGRDSVKILEDTDGDGRADKVTTFADGLNIPIGILPLPNCKGCIVYSIPNIWLMLDTDGDGKADVQRVLYSEFGARDTHGMVNGLTMGFDGWVYACHGFSNSSTVVGGDGSVVRMQSGNTFRFKPDGSRVEQWTWGQVNPFGMALDPLGNLYTADCHSKPVYQLLRGAYYPSFGKPHDGLGFGPEMCSHSHGSTAICGLVYYAADHFPKEYHDTLFIGNVVTNRINHDKIEWHGSTPKAIEQPDFLKSDDPWFRPVDLKLGPDGALYLADFYNRIIGHYEVPLTHPGRDRERGRIWRIVYRYPGEKGRPVRLPDFTAVTDELLIANLYASNLTRRLLAMNQLVERGKSLLEEARHLVVVGESAGERFHAIWILERLGALSDELLTAAARDKDATVRVHAMRVLANRLELSGIQKTLVKAGLRDDNAHVQRASVEALGRHPSPDGFFYLLYSALPKDDTHLLHMIRISLRDHMRERVVMEALASQGYNKLSAEYARVLADVSLGVATEETVNFLWWYVARHPEPTDRLAQMIHHLARNDTRKVGLDPDKLDFLRENRPDDLRHQAALFKAVYQGIQERGAALGAGEREWAEALIGRLLASKQAEFLAQGADLAGMLKMKSTQSRLANLAADRAQPSVAREAAISALTLIEAKAHAALLGNLLADAAAPSSLREKAAQALAASGDEQALDRMLPLLPVVPARLQTAIATGLAGTPAGAEKLLTTVAAGKASARLLQDKVVLQRLNQAKIPELPQRLAKLTEGLPALEQRWQELIKQRSAGFAKFKPDAELGAKLFAKNCANCHQIANQGTKIGPQLDGIGVRGVDRLLEDLLDPNRNVDQAFRSTTLVLTRGQILTGLVLREEGEVVVLADQQGKEVRVEKKDIDERSTSQLSPMPPNLIDQIPEGDFYHLMAFLLRQRPR